MEGISEERDASFDERWEVVLSIIANCSVEVDDDSEEGSTDSTLKKESHFDNSIRLSCEVRVEGSLRC